MSDVQVFAAILCASIALEALWARAALRRPRPSNAICPGGLLRVFSFLMTPLFEAPVIWTLLMLPRWVNGAEDGGALSALIPLTFLALVALPISLLLYSHNWWLKLGDTVAHQGCLGTRFEWPASAFLCIKKTKQGHHVFYAGDKKAFTVDSYLCAQDEVENFARTWKIPIIEHVQG